MSVLNEIADMLFPSLTVEAERGWAFVSFKCWHKEERIRRRWDARGGSHFPTWKSHPWGGTRTMCIDQLCRRILGKPVAPLGTWHYLIDGPAKLCSGEGEKLKNLLIRNAWPVNVPCVLCGKSISSCGDWWTIKKGCKTVSGPSCSVRDCREELQPPAPASR